MNKLYFGDNLEVMRQHIKDESVDLIYLDPPFNSNANYNLLFKSPHGDASDAQAEAFRDTWGWGQAASDAYEDVMSGGGDAALVLKGFRQWLGENAMMAYLAMMTVRLIELRRALKPNGSLYLHCDPTASHYLRIILDAIFDHRSFVNELTWKRSHAHSDARQGARHYGRVSDRILFYSLSDERCWNVQYAPYSETYLSRDYRRVDPDGRRFRLDNIQGPGGAAKGNPFYEVMGVSRHWRYSKKKMQELIDQGLIVQTRPGAVPQRKRYLDEMPGVPLQDIWTDIPIINNRSKERLGYPTQKPLALLERILNASSEEGDVILDPFCGCGTTVEAAEKLGRTWIGIDVTHYAVTLIEGRIKNGHPDADFSVHGRPADLAGASDLARRDKHQFQWWASWYLGAQSYREEKRGADRGIDGNIYFANGPYGTGRIIISVKGGANIGVSAVRELHSVVEREGAEMGILVTLANPTSGMASEAAAHGSVQISAHGRIPKLQITTVADMLDGRFPYMPPLPQPVYKPAPRGRKRKRDTRQMELLLPIEGLAIAPSKEDFVDPRFMRFGT